MYAYIIYLFVFKKWQGFLKLNEDTRWATFQMLLQLTLAIRLQKTTEVAQGAFEILK